MVNAPRGGGDVCDVDGEVLDVSETPCSGDGSGVGEVVRISSLRVSNVLNGKLGEFFGRLLEISRSIEVEIESCGSFLERDLEDSEVRATLLKKLGCVSSLTEDFNNVVGGLLNGCGKIRDNHTSPDIATGLINGIRFRIHEFNNILTIFGFGTELLKEGLEECDGNCNQFLSRYYEPLKEGCDLMKKLFKELDGVFVSREKNGGSYPVVLTNDLGIRDTLLMRVVKNLFSLPGYEIEDKIKPDISIVMDSSKFDSLMFELFRNAYQAMSDGGKVTRRIDCIVDYNNKEWCVIEFSDTGCGMSEEVRFKILKGNGFTTKPRGTGLGLQMIRTYVKEAGGYIMVSSSPGEGTTFKIFLPAKTDAVSV